MWLLIFLPCTLPTAELISLICVCDCEHLKSSRYSDNYVCDNALLEVVIRICTFTVCKFNWHIIFFMVADSVYAYE